MKWKNEKNVKKNEMITNLLIKQNDYEKINHLMSDWSSNWENNNINYEELLLTIKKIRKHAWSRQINNTRMKKKHFDWVNHDISNSILIENSDE